MDFFEIGMLICFGLSWPISIFKALRTKQVAGKSSLFLWIVIFGYSCGIAHKLRVSLDPVIWLYCANMALVAFDLSLYYRYKKFSPKTE